MAWLSGLAFYVCIVFIFVYFLIVGFTGSSLQRMGSSSPCAGFLWVWQAGPTLRCSAPVARWAGFSRCRVQAPGHVGSAAAARGR